MPSSIISTHISSYPQHVFLPCRAALLSHYWDPLHTNASESESAAIGTSFTFSHLHKMGVCGITAERKIHYCVTRVMAAGAPIYSKVFLHTFASIFYLLIWQSCSMLGLSVCVCVRCKCFAQTMGLFQGFSVSIMETTDPASAKVRTLTSSLWLYHLLSMRLEKMWQGEQEKFVSLLQFSMWLWTFQSSFIICFISSSGQHSG